MTGVMEEVPSIQILDTRVNMVRMADVMVLMARWIEEEPHRLHHLVNTGMHGIMEGHKDPAFGAILNSADLLYPDGILAILVARFHGYRLKKKDTGPDLLWRFSEIAGLEVSFSPLEERIPKLPRRVATSLGTVSSSHCLLLC